MGTELHISRHNSHEACAARKGRPEWVGLVLLWALPTMGMAANLSNYRATGFERFPHGEHAHRMGSAMAISRLAAYDGGIPWVDDRWFLLGVNYPWFNYGHDFGTTAWGHDGVSSASSSEQVDADFAYLQSQGVRVVRWFLLGDCRAAPEFDGNGLVTGYDDYFYADLDAAVRIARQHDICLILVLLDFLVADGEQIVGGVQLGGRAEIITDADIRLSFLGNALRPLLERYGHDRTIIAWEVMNEPEGAMNVAGGGWVDDAVAPDVMQSFVNDVVSYIHAHSLQHATVGSASRGQLGYWVDSNLDFYQYHYYDHMESQYPLDYPEASLGLDQPCILGEFPTSNTTRTTTEYLQTIYDNGYAGAFAWSYRAGDPYSDFAGAAAQYLAWFEAHQQEVDIRVPHPVYRFWSPSLSRHFYTISEDEKDLVLADPLLSSVWDYETVAYHAFPADSPMGLTPVYRFWSPVLSAHFYTVSEDEKDLLLTDPFLSTVWDYETIAFYAYPEGSQPAGTSPVHRFWSNALGTHFYTISEDEKNYVTDNLPAWEYETIAWYAYE